jgi:hypothetical protein
MTAPAASEKNPGPLPAKALHWSVGHDAPRPPVCVVASLGPPRSHARRVGAFTRSPCQSPYKCPRNCSIAPWHNRSGLHSPALASSMSRLVEYLLDLGQAGAP